MLFVSCFLFSQEINVHKTDGSTITYPLAEIDSITFTIDTTGTFTCGTSTVTFTYRGSSVTYGTVSHNSECWLDRNLGASQIATAYNDENAYGDLFQWGRLDDDHQGITWTNSTTGTPDHGTTSTNSSTDVPGHSNFILEPNDPWDWRDPQNNNLWQGVSGINNPCPSGWRIPTEAELETERTSWGTNDYNGAYASPLKLVVAGYRNDGDGALSNAGSGGYCWSSTVAGINARYLYFSSGYATVNSYDRAFGFSVRCIKD